MSIRAIARRYGVSHTAVNKKAKIEGWRRYAPAVKVTKNDVEKRHKMVLGRVALRKIEEIKNELGQNYSHVDEPLIVMYAKNYEKWLQLAIEVDEEGEVVVSPKTGAKYLNPKFSAMKSIEKTLVTIANQLGLSIASRKKLGIDFNQKDRGPTLFDVAKLLDEEIDVDV